VWCWVVVGAGGGGGVNLLADVMAERCVSVAAT